MIFDRSFRYVFLFLAIVVCFVSVSGVFGANVSVSGTGFSDIQDAVDVANEHDTIKLGNVTYSGSGDYIKVNKSNIVIEGSSRSSVATLDAKKGSRIMLINATNVTLRFITFVNGDSGGESGGALLFRGTTLIVDNCSFVGNDGESGGAVAVGDGYSDVLINNSRFVNNKGSYLGGDGVAEGGAVDSHADFTRVFNCVFIGNSAITHGGALTLRGDNAFVENCSFVNNFAGDGGAVYLSGLVGDGLFVRNCNFSNNYANGSDGGAVRVISSFLSFVSCGFVNNRAGSARGGGLFVGSGVVNLSSCSFSGNSAGYGGGVYSSSSLRLFNISFVNNHATANGGGLYSVNSLTIGGSSVFSGNMAFNGGAVYSTGPMVVNSSSFKNNLASSYGGAFYSTNSLTINGGSITGNNASYGSGVYNTGFLRLDRVVFVNNKAKVFSIVAKAPNYVIKGDKVIVDSYLTCGDNILNAIYTTNTNVLKDGINISKSNKVSGATIKFEANNKNYTAKSSGNGVATIKIPTLSASSSSNLKITVLYNNLGNPIKKTTIKISYKSLSKTKLNTIKNSIKRTKVSDYNTYSKILNNEKQIKQYQKDVKKSKISSKNKNEFTKLSNKILSSITTKKIQSLYALSKTINNKRTFASSSEKNSYSSQLNDLKKTVTNSNSLSKTSKKNNVTAINKLIDKVEKLPVQSRAPLQIITYEGDIKVVTNYSDLIKSKNDEVIITAKVFTQKNITVNYTVNYHEIVGNKVFNSSSYSYYVAPALTEYGERNITVDDQVNWVLLSNNNKEKYKWYYQNSTINKFYKGTKEVLKYDKNGKIIWKGKYYNQEFKETLHRVVQEDFSKYVLPAEFCESDAPEIISLANQIKANCSDKSDFFVANAIKMGSI
ncbi:MAG: hypothetical protein ACRC1M_07400 [Methanobacteriaceae archaeon]